VPARGIADLTGAHHRAYEGGGRPQQTGSLALRIRLSLPPTATAPRIARERVAALGTAVPEGSLNDLNLLCTEVVTNAVKYAGLSGDEAIRVDVHSYPNRVEVSIRYPDHNEFDPAGSGDDPGETRGWRLLFVDQLADRWRVERTDGDVEVWFQIGFRSTSA
jgi:anti-sigma regulatory factor (Ser/Thr protein kinase)